MTFIRSLFLVLFYSVLSTLASIADDAPTSQGSTYCEPNGKFCISMAIPRGTADLDNGEVFFTVQANMDGGWLGIGIGEGMDQSIMFMIYPSDSTNVTVSPRLGRNHELPLFYPQTNINLLEGSGVDGTLLNAKFSCQNCKRWPGGQINLTDTQQSWIWAQNQGDSIRTYDVQATLKAHGPEDMGVFGFNMNATLTDKVDTAPTINIYAIGAAPSTKVVEPAGKALLILLHAIIMGIVFILLLPFGAVIIRLLRHVIRRSFYAHVALQLFSFFASVASLGIGVRISSMNETHFLYSHQKLGAAVMLMLFIQVILGATHHTLFRMKGHRTLVTTAHVWFGRLCIVLGVINGGLGLNLPDVNASSFAIAIYAGAASLMFMFWLLGFGATKLWEHKMGLDKKIDEERMRQAEDFQKKAVVKVAENAAELSEMKRKLKLSRPTGPIIGQYVPETFDPNIHKPRQPYYYPGPYQPHLEYPPLTASPLEPQQPFPIGK